MKNNFSNMDEYRKSLHDYKKIIDEIRINLDNTFDKYMLTFSTGSLYLSVLFTNGITRCLSNKYLLFLGWILLLSSIVTSLLSILFSVKAFEERSNAISNFFKKETPIPDYIKWERWIDRFECVSIVGFIFGLLLLAIFYFFNLA